MLQLVEMEGKMTENGCIEIPAVVLEQAASIMQFRRMEKRIAFLCFRGTEVPEELLAICRELGITEDKVNIILRTTEEGTDEKTGV